jgi:amidohydrolase
VVTTALLEQAVSLRRTIHANPELSHEEFETAALVRRELEAAGITEIATVGGTAGLVATIRGGQPGKVLAMRGDMDALPLQEENQTEYASGMAGVMHACGHDSHTAMLVSVAKALQAEREQWAGEFRAIFQPAEEAEPLGARDIVGEGFLDGVDAVIGCHVDPSVPVGMVGGLQAGPRTAAADELTITIHGRSSHGAAPQAGIDAVGIAASIIQEIQKIASRMTNPRDAVVVTIGKIQGGAARNIVADRVVLDGTIRSISPETRERVHHLVAQIAEGVARLHDGSADVSITRGEPVLVNDPTMVELVRAAAVELLGEERIVEIAPAMGADDFAFYAERVPGVMFRIGARNEEQGITYPLHHPKFDIDEDAIRVAVPVLHLAARNYLVEPG